MLRVGLTGGIATGKTTVAAIFRELGCRILDADKIAHRLIEPRAAAYEDVIREFGRGILMPDGHVDRQKLGAIVFADPARLARLNAIVHPHVLDVQDHELDAIERADPGAIAVVEAALLIEAGYASKLDCLVVTWCTPEQQLARLTRQDAVGGAGRGLTLKQARQRIAAQMPIEEKRRMADEVIDCAGSLEHTREQVVALVAKLKGMEAGKTRHPQEVDRNDRREK
jgi:dephospho-CoA kinase